MRFGIRDLLVIALLVALCAFAIQSYRRAQELEVQIAAAQFDFNTKTSKLMLMQLTTVNAPPLIDFATELGKTRQQAAQGFADVQERHGRIEPKPDTVSLRSVPEFSEHGFHYVSHYRINVPENKVVFLRSAFDQLDGSANSSTFLNQRPWLQNAPFTDSKPHQIRVEPGIHDITIRAKPTQENGRAMIQLILDGRSILETESVLLSARCDGWQSKVWHYQIELAFDAGVEPLGTADIHDESGRRDFEFVVWLSTDPSPAGNTDYPFGESE